MTMSVSTIPSVSAGCWATFNSGFAAIGIDPFVTLHELIKFSWLLDYFVDIGDTIGALRPQVGVSIDKCWIYQRVDTQIEFKVVGADKTSKTFVQQSVTCGSNTSPDASYVATWTPPKIGGSITEWTRIPASPSDMAKMPRVDVNINIAKFLDIATLVSQLLGKNSKTRRATNRLLRL